jgi:hypothetical protein
MHQNVDACICVIGCVFVLKNTFYREIVRSISSKFVEKLSSLLFLSNSPLAAI